MDETAELLNQQGAYIMDLEEEVGELQQLHNQTSEKVAALESRLIGSLREQLGEAAMTGDVVAEEEEAEEEVDSSPSQPMDVQDEVQGGEQLSFNTVGLTCNVCNTTFVKKANLMRHRKVVHLKNNRVTCTVCQQTFISAEKLRGHQSCIGQSSACDKVMSRKAFYAQPFPPSVSPPAKNKNTHRCSFTCKATFQTLSKLKRHVRVHAAALARQK